MQSSYIRSVLIQLGEPEWTAKALHLACTVARANSCGLTIVKLVPVDHPGWLGSELGNRSFTMDDQNLLRECSITAEDYGAPCSVAQYQYVILSDAIFDAAEYFDAQLTFAMIPRCKLPFWRRFLMWRLRRQFDGRERILNTLDDPIVIDECMPSSAVSAPVAAEKAC